MGENVIPVKSKRFAVRIVRPHQYLRREKQETVLNKQILRSGTSIGANASEGVCAISGKIRETPTKTRRTRREKEADI